MTEYSIEKLAERGFLVDLPHGGKGVPVSLQYRRALSNSSRAERKEELAEGLEDVAELVRSVGGVVDLDSLSISAQTLEGIIPADRYAEVVKALDAKDTVRLDLLLNRQVL